MFQPQKRQGNGVDRVGRKFQILTLLFEGFDPSEGYREDGWKTCYQIAKAIQLTPSNHLRGILEELIDENVVVYRIVPHRPDLSKVQYAIAPEARWTKSYIPMFDVWLGAENTAVSLVPEGARRSLKVKSTLSRGK